MKTANRKPEHLSEMMANECRACSNVRGNVELAAIRGVYTCAACGAIFGSCYLGDSYGLVSPYMTASVAVDYQVTQVVDGTKGIHGMIPKAIFAGQ